MSMFGFRFVARAAFATVFTVVLLSSVAAEAQGVCNFLYGSQRTACHDAAVAMANKKAADAAAKAAANQPPADANATGPGGGGGSAGSQPAPASANAAAKPAAKPGTGADAPVNYVQKNTYRGGIEDCTGSSCTGSRVESQSAANLPPCNGNMPGMYCYDGTVTDRAQKVLDRHDVTADDVIKCNSVYSVAAIFRSGGNDAALHQAALGQIPDNVNTNERYLWDLIYVLSPRVQQAPLADRNNTMTFVGDHQINDDILKYQVDYQPLLVDYKACIAKGLPPSGL
jgi:hypothetical protein